MAVAAAGLAIAAAFHSHERGQQLSRIQGRLDFLKIRQADLKVRFDALLAESAKAPNDPVLLKSLGARHLELVKEEEANKSGLDEIQKEIRATKE